MYLKFEVLLILSAVFAQSSSLNILALFPHPGKSHFTVFEPLLKALAAKGHNLTVISPFPQKQLLPRYRDISLEHETNIIFNSFDIKLFQNPSLNAYISPLIIASLAENMCLNLRSKPIQDFLKSDEKFDLVITEIFGNDCYLGFVHKYKVPSIGLGSNVMMPWANHIFGNPDNPAYIPIIFSSFSDRMAFWERVKNTVLSAYAQIMYKLYIEYPSYKEAKMNFGEDLPPLNEIAMNISLMLVNSHFSLNFPRPFVPNVVEVGGLFIDKPDKLPQKIEKFINESKHGVIFFSMGSILKGHTFPEEKRKAFLNVFSKLKQRVLWKWEEDSMPNQTDNIMIQKWFPQLDVLCHPNVKGLISHGGLLSLSEAVHCGVPAVSLPQFGDQFLNAKALEVKQVGVVLSLLEATEESISDAVNKILQPSFKENAEKLSTVYRDRPQSAMDTAIYWIEYVARYKGAPHLKIASTDLSMYQYLLLDVTAFLILCAITIFVIIYYLFKVMLRLLFKKTTNKLSKQMKLKNK